MGGETRAMHGRTAWGLWAVLLPQRTASLWPWAVQLLQYPCSPPGSGGPRNSCNAQVNQLGGRGVLPKRRSLP